MTALTDAGFGTAFTDSSAAPETDGYVGMRGGLPYNVHPTATPDEWLILTAAIAAGEVQPMPFVPLPAPAPEPNLDAWMSAVKIALGGPVALNALLRAYPLLQPSLVARDWVDAQALLADAKATAAITAVQAVAINAAATAASIPIVIY
jgi:hypothetical protein